MSNTITVNNDSGAAQSVVVLVVDPGQPGAFPLVWQSATIQEGVTHMFDCDNNTFGFGWGKTNTPIAPGVRFFSRQIQAADPVGTAGANNCARLTYCSGGFSIDTPYLDKTVPDGQLVLASDQSFNVCDAKNFCIALSLKNVPVMAQQLAPNTSYYFDPLNILFYLTVSTALVGTAVPAPVQNMVCLAISISNPTLVTFLPGTTDLAFKLTSNLAFQPDNGS